MNLFKYVYQMFIEFRIGNSLPQKLLPTDMTLFRSIQSVNGNICKILYGVYDADSLELEALRSVACYDYSKH